MPGLGCKVSGRALFEDGWCRVRLRVAEVKPFSCRMATQAFQSLAIVTRFLPRNGDTFFHVVVSPNQGIGQGRFEILRLGV